MKVIGREWLPFTWHPKMVMRRLYSSFWRKEHFFSGKCIRVWTNVCFQWLQKGRCCSRAYSRYYIVIAMWSWISSNMKKFGAPTLTLDEAGFKLKWFWNTKGPSTCSSKGATGSNVRSIQACLLPCQMCCGAHNRGSLGNAVSPTLHEAYSSDSQG